MPRAAIAYQPDSESDADAKGIPLSGADRYTVVAVVRDERGPRRSGLAEALGRIAAGEASALVAARLGDLAGSLRELVALLDWLRACARGPRRTRRGP